MKRSIRYFHKVESNTDQLTYYNKYPYKEAYKCSWIRAHSTYLLYIDRCFGTDSRDNCWSESGNSIPCIPTDIDTSRRLENSVYMYRRFCTVRRRKRSLHHCMLVQYSLENTNTSIGSFRDRCIIHFCMGMNSMGLVVTDSSDQCNLIRG